MELTVNFGNSLPIVRNTSLSLSASDVNVKNLDVKNLAGDGERFVSQK